VGLAESLVKAKEASRKGAFCSMCRLIDDLDKDDREALVSALKDPTIYSSTIGRALRSEGYKMADVTVQRHRRGGCVAR
jgi:hypothetical protein